MKSYDIRNALSRASIYDLFSNILAPRKTYSILSEEYIRPKKGDKILDIGCGISRILDFLPNVEYLGLDMNSAYIATAIKKYGNRGTFVCEKINKELVKRFSDYNIILALGILHHLDDLEAYQLFAIAKNALKPGGRLITFDGCYIKGQSKFTRYLLSKDRGKYVRTRDEYIALASRIFTSIEEYHRSDLLSVTYNHIIIECTA